MAKAKQTLKGLVGLGFVKGALHATEDKIERRSRRRRQERNAAKLRSIGYIR